MHSTNIPVNFPGNYLSRPRQSLLVFVWLGVGILVVFVARTVLAARGDVIRLNDLFTVIILTGSLVVLISGYRGLRRSDWLVALSLGAVVGIGMVFASLFMPYPFLGIVRNHLAQAWVRGFCVILAMLGGLVIMRQGGPVQLRAAHGDWGKFGRSLIIGLVLGIPLAVVNVFALQLTQGRPVDWQKPLAACLDAIQPGVVEEVIYRFAFVGLLWLVLRRSQPDRAAWLSGLLALLVHTFQHFDELLIQSPLAALGMGLVMAVVWGLPPTILALRRDLEAAVAFHWVQDAARFLTGY